MHAFDGKTRGTFVHIDPKLTLTGSMADQWVPISPYKNLYLVLGIINYIKLNKLNVNPIPNTFPNLYQYSVSETSRITGVPEETIIKIAKDFTSSKSSIAIGGGYASSASNDYKTIVAINLLNEIRGNGD